MHAMLVTFASTGTPDEFAALVRAQAPAIDGVPGLLAVFWLRAGTTLGGFHVFADRQAAERYLDGGMVAGLSAHPAFSRFAIRHFGVLEQASHPVGAWASGGPGRPPNGR